VFTISLPKESKRQEADVNCQLGKEIQLKHRAPVVHIILLDGIGSPIPIPGEVEAGLAHSPDLVGPHKVVICSEEQFKVTYDFFANQWILDSKLNANRNLDCL
jgi:lethal(2) giant larvae protein